MTLPTLVIPELRLAKFKYSGLDSLNKCIDPDWFRQWTLPIDYVYNQRGFRDREWPRDLKSAVWCLGDSFTAGVGSPVMHNWPTVLNSACEPQTINISMDGASNDWIARKCCEIYAEIQPTNIVIMWSYIHRRELPAASKSDLDRRLYHANTTMLEDYTNLAQCRRTVHEYCTQSNIVELIIPDWHPGLALTSYNKMRDPAWPALGDLTANNQDIFDELKETYSVDTELLAQRLSTQRSFDMSNLIQVAKLDRSRDGHHFDIVTAEWIAAAVVPKLKV